MCAWGTRVHNKLLSSHLLLGHWGQPVLQKRPGAFPGGDPAHTCEEA